ncbi:dGTPase [Halanaerobium congolense]|jgi:dGTPase|uniref:Deoxyguanosinetriphosphate triphosphohydrolase-like protein n=1 Tax=Halanaerobium congolense TaxID=54121 RepID=A0A1M7MK88_9FIRM|nr:deoxyguanosinetriphosphate triphosphohydrolase [Halanaerobium congolense]OEG62645.1 MAG: deoxyguanosinetriphosphate triphosphohydrolase [Halanaerobium sp. MDAL1]PUU92734.1 MAG: dGTPase [Halanaerobium sp.]PXV66396.1 dGTPase [Halanaerobium congolense]TDP15647.1 dGTPase [Halanaerobium congolense]SDI82251.1 dGTPase [Halanaerobium congolense]
MFSRVEQLEWEKEKLSPAACLSSESKGRLKKEDNCDIRTIFQHDRDRIIHSKAFRRLKHKTQVFIAPEGDHYRTRLTHTLEVSQIARTIARALKLNEDLVEAIALGHDLGHTPFGHAGEAALTEITGEEFNHNIQSLRVVDLIEKRSSGSRGLNLSLEVRDGILNHTGPDEPFTLEGQIVRIADRVAYINHDIDDALRAGIIKQSDLPADSIDILGETHSQRIDVMVRDLINTSWEPSEIKRSAEVEYATEKLRDFLFENVYIGSEGKSEEGKAKRLLKLLYEFFMENIDNIPDEYLEFEKNHKQAVIDYIAGMTDRYAINLGRKFFIPTPWFDNN